MGLIYSMLNILGYLLLGVAVLGYFVYRLLHNSAVEDSVSDAATATCDAECDEVDDGSERCFYGFPEAEQHCPICDHAEQCIGISFRDDEE